MNRRIVFALGLGLGLVACAGDVELGEGETGTGETGETGETGDDYTGVDTPASQNPPLATCPMDAPTLGTAGSTDHDLVELTWDSNGVESYIDGYLYFVIPSDILSLLIAVEQGAEYTAINNMAIDGEVYVDLPNAIGEAPFYHWPVEVASVAMPIDGDTAPPGGGCLALDPVVYADVAGETGTLHLVTRRGPDVDTAMDINVFVVGETVIAEADITAALTHMDEVYQGGGSARLGDVSISALDWPNAYVDMEGQEIDDLRAATTSDRPTAMNVLFVQDFTETGWLGFAAGIPGPNGVPATAASGVIVSVDTHLDGDGVTVLTDLMGETMAHEFGHQLGLFHTTEDTGTEFDGITDTAECPLENDADGDEEMSAEECADLDGRNFMFWTSSDEFGQYEMSPIQAMVLRDSVIARPQ
jgi:hypothetical protein